MRTVILMTLTIIAVCGLCDPATGAIGESGSAERASAEALRWTCATSGVTCEDVNGTCQVVRADAKIEFNSSNIASVSFPNLLDVSGLVSFSYNSRLTNVSFPL